MLRDHFNEQAASFLVLDGVNPAHRALLARAWHEIYLPAFPIDSERESLEKMNRLLGASDIPVRMVVVVAGQHLQDPQTAALHAMSVAYYYPKSAVGLLAYNAVDPARRAQGCGRKMVDARIKALQGLAAADGRELTAVLIEVNDPAKVRPEEDVMDPARRMALFEKWGACVLDIPYVQPPLEVDAVCCDNLKLMAYPVAGVLPAPSVLKNFIEEVYSLVPPERRDKGYERGFSAMQAALDGKAAALPPEIKAKVEIGGAVGDEPGRDKIDAGGGDDGDLFKRHPARGLQRHKPFGYGNGA